MRKPPRIAVFLVILAAVAVWVMQDEGPKVSASRPANESSAVPDSREAVAAAGSAIRAELPARDALQRSRGNPFSPQSWIPVPPPTVSVPQPAPVATAPPLPYRYVGEFVLPTGTQVFLARGEDTFRVSEGETLDGEYRVESLKSGELVFVHLASGVHQTMRFTLPSQDNDIAARAMLRTAQAPIAQPDPATEAPKVAPALNAARAASDEQGRSNTVARPAEIRWDGPASARAGSSFSVALRMTSGERVRSTPMQLRFDPKLLEPVSVRPGRFFGVNGAANFGYRVNADGSIYIGASNPAPADAADAELLVLTFRPIKAGTSAELSVAALNLQGPAGRTIAYTALTAFKTTIVP